MKKVVVLTENKSFSSWFSEKFPEQNEVSYFSENRKFPPAFENLKTNCFQFVFIIDFDFLCKHGLDFLNYIRNLDCKKTVIVFSKENSLSLAERIKKIGFSDFLPWPSDDLRLADRLISHEIRINPDYFLPDAFSATNDSEYAHMYNLLTQEERDSLDEFSGVSDAVHNIKKQVMQIAGSNLPVHISGETGTGKSVLAEIIHRLSARRRHAFVEESMYNIPSELAEAELFGTEKGGFTGAETKKGLVRQADGGTLFLDEIAGAEFSLQGRLLRILSSGKVRAVGCSSTEYDVNLRLITATNKDLCQCARNVLFMPDLYYRLMGYTICIPPLRERPLDLLHITEKISRRLGKELSQDALNKITAHAWPGNVRELKYTLEAAAGLCSGKTITAADISILPSPF